MLELTDSATTLGQVLAAHTIQTVLVSSGIASIVISLLTLLSRSVRTMGRVPVRTEPSQVVHPN